ncbi:MAG: hypothetical protein KatS3mg039_0718 [Candidatus Kapaibacterium sp.]|nr:MAG: hypothetical protein KatS3mg039_0718 [Candidatus Kapabacteria bacterium]
METTIFVLAAVILIALLVLIIVGVRLLLRLNGVIEVAEEALEQSQQVLGTLSTQLPSVLDSIENLSVKATQTLDEANQKLAIMGDAFDQFRQVSERINWLERRLQEKIEGPLMDAAKVVAGVTKAIKTFADAFNRR